MEQEKLVTMRSKAFESGPTIRTLWIVGILLGLVLAMPHAAGHQQAEGAGSYLLGPSMPTVFTFDRSSMSCSVSWGTMAAPGPGPFSDTKMKLDKVNFGMVVFSLKVNSFKAVNNHVTMSGQARSITTVNDKIVENAIYQFKVEAIDDGAAPQDRFSMTLQRTGLMFDGHTFAPAAGAGLVAGDIVIRP